VNALAVLPDGRIASGSRDKTVRISRTPCDGSIALSSLGFAFTSAVTALAVDPRSGHLAIGFADGRVLVFAIEPEGECGRAR
jgi:hypothetical protein